MFRWVPAFLRRRRQLVLWAAHVPQAGPAQQRGNKRSAPKREHLIATAPPSVAIWEEGSKGTGYGPAGRNEVRKPRVRVVFVYLKYFGFLCCSSVFIQTQNLKIALFSLQQVDF